MIFSGILLRILWKDERIQSSWAKVCDENLLNYLLIKGENKQRRIPYILAVIISFVLTLAAAGPSWEKKNNPALSADNPVMIMLNLSSDMWIKDVSPSRIVRAKYIIKDLLDDLRTTETFSFANTDGTTTETDLYGWLPDSAPEFNDFLMQYGRASVHDNCIAYGADLHAATGEKLVMTQSGTHAPASSTTFMRLFMRHSKM